MTAWKFCLNRDYLQYESEKAWLCTSLTSYALDAVSVILKNKTKHFTSYFKNIFKGVGICIELKTKKG